MWYERIDDSLKKADVFSTRKIKLSNLYFELLVFK